MLDGFRYERAGGCRIESIENPDGYILVENGINCRRIDHFCSVEAKFHALNKGHVGHDCRLSDYPGVGRHESVYVCPYFEGISPRSGSNQGGCEVASSASEIRDSSGFLVGGYESGDDGPVFQAMEFIFNQRGGELLVGNVF